MITQFLLQQMDYIFFCYGFSFILLAFVCYALRKESRQRLPWIWLGLFGITHGVNEWLDMLALELGDGYIFSVARLGLMALSYIFLLEFGRDGWRALGGKGPGGWIHLPLLAGVAAGAIVPKSAFFPASVVNQDSFLGLTGVPIQLVRGILALLITYALWMHYEHSRRQGLPEIGRIEKESLRNRIVFTGVMALIYRGNENGQEGW